MHVHSKMTCFPIDEYIWCINSEQLTANETKNKVDTEIPPYLSRLYKTLEHNP